MEEIVIIGGGIAGLSCLNALIDLGVSALLIEANTIGTAKMCGEFIAHAAVLQLEVWNIGPLVPITQATFFANNNHLNLNFKQAAGAFSRSEVELQLAARVRLKGGRILENTPIQHILPPSTADAPYTLQLSNGDTILAKTAIFATGKFGQTLNPIKPSPYLGLKLHFNTVVKPNTLLMYSLAGAYFGLVPINKESSNCACLIQRKAVLEFGSCKAFLAHVIQKNAALKPFFKEIDILSSSSFEGPVPEFHLKTIPDWPNAFWIGDALASFYPAIGYGFAHSINSAMMAARDYVQRDEIHYHRSVLKMTKPKLWMGKWMHQLLLTPQVGRLTFPMLEAAPWIPQFFLNKLNTIPS